MSKNNFYRNARLSVIATAFLVINSLPNILVADNNSNTPIQIDWSIDLRTDTKLFSDKKFGSIVNATPEGLLVTGVKNNPPIVTCTDVGLTVNGKWLTVRMKADSGLYGGFWFKNKSKEPVNAILLKYSFPIKADGNFHTYNVWLGDYYLTPRLSAHTVGEDPAKKGVFPGELYKIGLRKSEFKGEISEISVIPVYVDNGNGVVESISIADRPSGPVVLIAEYCGAAESVYRTGRSGVFGIRIRNAGGIPATGVKIKFKTDAGFVIDDKSIRCVPEMIPPDEELTIYFSGTAKEVSESMQFIATVSCNEGDAVTTKSTLFKVYPPYAGKVGEIPPPSPIKTKYKIGAWYFPDWAKLTQWTSVVSSFERRPAVGYYDESAVISADWAIKWAVEHGVNYFQILIWIDDKGNISLGSPFVSSFIKSHFIDYIKFNFCWENVGGTFMTKDAFAKAISNLAATYFIHPSYEKHDDGRIVMAIINADGFVKKNLKGNAEQAKEYMEEADRIVKAAGFPGIYWKGGGISDKNGKELRNVGFNAATTYNWPGVSAGAFPVRSCETYLGTATEVWNNYMPKNGFDIYLPVVTGFDHRGWKGARTPQWVFPEINKVLFTNHLHEVKARLDSLGKKDILIESWNEMGEGSCLGPYALIGFQLLEGLREVFAPGEKPRKIVEPKDVGVYVPEVPELWDWARYPHLDSKGAVVDMDYGVNIPKGSYPGQP